jgi:FtsH-binding integral membrane protein
MSNNITNTNTNNNEDKNRHHRNRHEQKMTWWVALIVIAWVFIGAWAYVSSFMCTHERYTGSDAQKIGMMLLAGMLGPLWFLILPFVKKDGYCQLKK